MCVSVCLNTQYPFNLTPDRLESHGPDDQYRFNDHWSIGWSLDDKKHTFVKGLSYFLFL